MTFSDQPEQTSDDDAVSEFDAGHRFYDAVLRSGFLMEPGWPNPIRRPVMSVHATLDRLEEDRAARAGALRRPAAHAEDAHEMPLDGAIASKVPCHGSFGGCDFATAA